MIERRCLPESFRMYGMTAQFVFAIVYVVSIAGCSLGIKPTKRGEYAHLEMTHATQRTNLCGPTSASMVMNYYGENHSQWSLKAATKGHKDLFSGTSFEEIVESARLLGYDWKIEAFENDSIGFGLGLAEIKHQLDRGRPPIIGLFWRHDVGPSSFQSIPGEPITLDQRRMGHAVVLYGYDETEQEIFIMDPAMEFPGRWHASYDEFRTLWTSGPMRVVVCTSPPVRRTEDETGGQEIAPHDLLFQRRIQHGEIGSRRLFGHVVLFG